MFALNGGHHLNVCI